MGYKASIITIKDPSTEISNEELLNKLSFSNFVYEGETTFDECMYPSDKSINIGHFNNCLIICDDYQLTTSIEMTKNAEVLGDYEKVLCEIFPGCEILTTSCHSVVNYHMYSLAVDGEKLRYKKVVSGDPVVEYGDRIFEEEEIYASSKMIDGVLMFNSRYDEELLYDNTEDQLMEEFTFGVAKRHLGVMISTGEEEELDGVVFKKYVKRKIVQQVKNEQAAGTQEKKRSWFSRLFG